MSYAQPCCNTKRVQRGQKYRRRIPEPEDDTDGGAVGNSSDDGGGCGDRGGNDDGNCRGDGAGSDDGDASINGDGGVRSNNFSAPSNCKRPRRQRLVEALLSGEPTAVAATTPLQQLLLTDGAFNVTTITTAVKRLTHTTQNNNSKYDAPSSDKPPMNSSFEENLREVYFLNRVPSCETQSVVVVDPKTVVVVDPKTDES